MGRWGFWTEKITVMVTAMMLFVVGVMGVTLTAKDYLIYYGTPNSSVDTRDVCEQKEIKKSLKESLKDNKSQDITISPTVTIDEANKIYMESFAEEPELFLCYAPKIMFFREKDNHANVVGYRMEYLSTESGEIRTKEVEDVVSSIIAETRWENSDKDKVICVLRWMGKHCKYTDTPNNMWDSSLYGCLVGGKATCMGYSEAFQLIMNRLGIPCEVVVDVNHKRHAWNRITVDGKEKDIDPTRSF